MKTKLIILTLAILTVSITACNKEKRFSKKLIKGEKWEVKDITVAGTSLNTFGVWSVLQDVNIYETVPQVLWTNDTSNTIFNWQFQEKGDLFQLNYAHDSVECDSSILGYLDYFAYDITGSYSVERHKRKSMMFKSSETIKYPGQQVEITIEKQ